VDATYRADLRELNELNFGRFDAKMGERIAELRGEMKAELAQLDARLTELRAEVTMQFTDQLRSLESRLVRWMLAFWVSTLIGLGGLFFRH